MKLIRYHLPTIVKHALAPKNDFGKPSCNDDDCDDNYDDDDIDDYDGCGYDDRNCFTGMIDHAR